jgi:peptidoglycan/LPS O-acetylase OafA/YrhL
VQQDISSRSSRSKASRDRILSILDVNRVAGRASSYHFDTIRGLAAVVVLLYHVRHLFYDDYHELGNRNVADLAIYGITNFGHEAVIVFFVLSGVLIGASVLRVECQGAWSWPSYVINRITRLHVVLIPALLLGVIWDQSGMRLTSGPSLYNGQVTNSVLNVSIHSREGLIVFIGNAFCLQTAFVPPFGSNLPLWSLANEFWYYLIFPFVVFACAPWRSIESRILSIGIVAFLLTSLGASIREYFPIWLIGVLVNFMPPRPPEQKYIIIGGTALVLFGTLAVLGWERPSGAIADLVLGMSCALFIYATIQDRRRISESSLYARISRRMAKCSYTLYLVHMPILVFISALWMRETRWKPHGKYLVAGIAIALFVFGYSLIVAFFTERRTDMVRQWLFQYSSPTIGDRAALVNGPSIARNP